MFRGFPNCRVNSGCGPYRKAMPSLFNRDRVADRRSSQRAAGSRQQMGLAYSETASRT